MPKYQSINNNLDKFSTQSFMENNNCFLSHHTALLPYQINIPPSIKLRAQQNMFSLCQSDMS